jgi:hypothetical protein
VKLDPDDGCDGVVRFCALHEASLDRRRAIFHVVRIDDPVDLDDEAAVRETLDRLAEASGYRSPGQAWRSIAEQQALRALDVLMRFDQAYLPRLVGDEAAAAPVAGFAALFPEPRSWHTTATFAERQARIDRDGERAPGLFTGQPVRGCGRGWRDSAESSLRRTWTMAAGAVCAGPPRDSAESSLAGRRWCSCAGMLCLIVETGRLDIRLSVTV